MECVGNVYNTMLFVCIIIIKNKHFKTYVNIAGLSVLQKNTTNKHISSFIVIHCHNKAEYKLENPCNLLGADVVFDGF